MCLCEWLIDKSIFYLSAPCLVLKLTWLFSVHLNYMNTDIDKTFEQQLSKLNWWLSYPNTNLIRIYRTCLTTYMTVGFKITRHHLDNSCLLHSDKNTIFIRIQREPTGYICWQETSALFDDRFLTRQSMSQLSYFKGTHLGYTHILRVWIVRQWMP